MSGSELSPADAERLGIEEGALCESSPPRHASGPGTPHAGREGSVFVPFHYGYWDVETDEGRAANELTATIWDPVSKQPLFKSGTPVRIAKIANTDGPLLPHRSGRPQPA